MMDMKYVMIGLLLAIQDEAELTYKHEAGEKYTAKVSVTTTGETAQEMKLGEGTFSCELESEVVSFDQDKLVCKCRLTRYSCKGTSKSKEADFDYQVDFDGTRVDSKLTLTRGEDLQKELDATSASLKETFPKTWEVKQGPLEAKCSEARKGFGVFNKQFEALYCWPGMFPFAPRKIKKGDAFEDRGFKFTVKDIAAGEAIVEGVMDRGNKGTMTLTMHHSLQGHPLKMKMVLVNQGATIITYEAEIKKN
jgi:hypothetical protein